MPPILTIEKIAAELASIKAMLENLTDRSLKEGGVMVNGLQHIIVPYGTTIGTAIGNQAMTQTIMEYYRI